MLNIYYVLGEAYGYSRDFAVRKSRATDKM